jgi:mRNA-degrading endonuclease RelE of RelBE toxin-antitoxin system
MSENQINLGIKIPLTKEDLKVKADLKQANENLEEIDKSLQILEQMLESKKKQNNENNYKYKVSSYLLFCSLNKDFKKEVSNLIKEKLNIKDDSKLIDENNIELLMKDENNRDILQKLHDKHTMNNRIV